MTISWLYQHKKTLLAPAIAAALLSGCGGSDSEPESATFSITAIDGYLHNAEVLVDTNLDNTCDKTLGMTNEQGKLDVDTVYQNKRICITAKVGETIDLTRGVVEKGFTLKAPIGSVVVSPLTNLVVDILAINNTLTLDEVKNDLLEAMQDSGMDVDETTVFGDYLAFAQSSAPEQQVKSKKLEIIGEALVDAQGRSNHTAATQLNLVKAITEQIKDADELIDLQDLQPTVKEDGTLAPTINHRPTFTGNDLKPYEASIVDGGGRLEIDRSVELKFTDSDADKLTFKIKSLTGDQPHVTISDEGIISGIQQNKAGNYLFHIYVVDSNGAKSRPVPFKLTLTTSNKAPALNPTQAAEFISDIKALAFIKGVEFPEQFFSLNDIFTDSDGDVIAYTVTTAPKANGLNVSIKQQQLQISGTPIQSGNVDITITATDSEHSKGSQITIPLTIQDQGVLVNHPLEGTVFYHIDNSSDSGEHPNLSCQAVKFENKAIYFSPESDTPFTCEEPTDNVGTYTIDGDTLTATILENGNTVVDDFTILNRIYENDGYLVRAEPKGRTNEHAWVRHFFTNAQHVDEQIDARGAAHQYLVWKGNEYISGDASVHLNGHSSLNQEPSVSITFSKSLSCEEIHKIYSSIFISDEAGYTVKSQGCNINELKQPTVVFSDLTGIRGGKLIDGHYYAVTTDLAPTYRDKMEPLMLRMKYQGVYKCDQFDSNFDEQDQPEQLSRISDYENAVNMCKKSSNANPFGKLESTLKTWTQDASAFKWIGQYETYMFEQTEESKLVTLTVHHEKGTDEKINANWKYEKGNLVIYNVKGGEGQSTEIIETLALIKEADQNLALLSLLQDPAYDELNLGNHTTHGAIQSKIYAFMVK
ncbi:hypothetical protein F0249_19325 [Vibrio sp. 03-59-1]|uniref:putative Ig domain-containing protein n=1 Tax=Vibrio sp. 03-59-1 TaxID=2607607 RepID=UPI001493A710|nr:putative Ig domain-containing protein [Vibrio sp. 03-59-1]NOH85940.1 hypothetical protein [Vibrio sp. 03-59-1]